MLLRHRWRGLYHGTAQQRHHLLSVMQDRTHMTLALEYLRHMNNV